MHASCSVVLRRFKVVYCVSHWPVSRSLSHDRLQSEGWTVGCVYCLDAQFSEEASKYVAGSLNALTAMVRDVLVVASFRAISHLDISFHVFCFLPRQVNIELPHVNVLTKLDLVRGRARQDGLIDWQDEDEDDERELIIPDRESLLRELNESYSHSKWLRLNEGIVSLLDEVRDTLRGLPGIRSYAWRVRVCLFACLLVVARHILVARLLTRLTRLVAHQWSLIGYVGLDPTSEDSISAVLMSLDMAIGWIGDEAEVRGQYDEGGALNEADFDNLEV